MHYINIPHSLLFQEALNQHVLSQAALFVGVLLLWTVVCSKILHWLFKIPLVAGQIVAGIALGPSLFNMARWQFFAHPMHLISQVTGNIYVLAGSDLFVAVIFVVSAIITVPYLLWLAGHETDPQEMRNVGAVAIFGGFFGAVLPVLFGCGTLYYLVPNSWTLVQAIGLGLTLSATSVSIPIAMLFSYQKMHLRSSKATLGAAVIDDILAVIFLSLFMIWSKSSVNSAFVDASKETTFLSALGSIVLVLGVACLLGYAFIPAGVKMLKRLKSMDLVPAFATIIMLIMFSFFELVGGLAGITGAYFAGLFHRLGDAKHKAESIIAPFVTSVLLPLFLGSIGLQMNMRLLLLKDWAVVMLLLVVAIFAKVIGCALSAGLVNIINRRSPETRWHLLETYLFGSSMVARGEVGLVVTTILYGANIFSPSQYAIAVVVIVLTTIAAPLLLAVGFRWLELSNQDAQKEGTKRVVIRRATAQVFGATRLFHLVADSLVASEIVTASTYLEEGKEVAVFKKGEQDVVRMVLCPDEGLVLEGDESILDELLATAKASLIEELTRTLP